VTTDRPRSRALARFVLVALVVPFVVVAIGVTLQLIVMPYVPATIAVHWNAAGEPDRFAPAWTQPLATVLFGAGIPVLIALTSLPGLRRGDRGVTYRFKGAVAAGTAALVTVAFTWTFVMQAGAPSEVVAGPVWPAVLASIVAAAVAGTLAWFLQPADEWARPDTPAAAPLAIAPGERVVWLRTAVMTRGVAIGIAVAVLAVVVGAFVAWLTGAPEGLVWLLGGLGMLLLVLAATTVAFHVRVDDAGLSVDSVLGVPRFRIRLADIASAAAVEVDPMGEFGGWGLRLSVDRRFGVVLRQGSAIQVTRANGRRFVVTVDDAATGAALLQALIARDAATRP
jgi:hypothetical protein